jgi:cobalt-zinc-cadmium efflux system outer membrane protein
VERAQASLVQSRKAVIPDLQLSGYLYNDNSPLLDANPSRSIGVMAGAQVGVQLPVFNRNQGNIDAANGEIESAKQELTRVKLKLQHDLAGIFRDYDSARLAVRQYQSEMLPRAQEAYRLYLSSYQKMAASYPQVLFSQRTLFQLQTDYLQTLESAWENALLIQGFALRDGLAAPR